MEVTVIGAGLAGCEVAWQLAQAGIKVKLYEKKKFEKNEVQKLDSFAELVCSNTFRSKSLFNAVGILKEELKLLNSFILECAYASEIPGDDALTVDRIMFSKLVDEKIRNHKNITIFEEENCDIDENDYTVIACGPIISSKFKQKIDQIIGEQKLFYLDASAPIVKKNSIDFSVAYYSGRHNKDNSYICLPLTSKQFEDFYTNLVEAKTVTLKEFEKEIFFKGCQPIENMAKISKKILLNGPLSPNGLEKNNLKPYAVIQLRRDDAIDELYNFVGFQTNLTWKEQKRVFQTIPGLNKVEFVRFGVMHKNYYINSPKILNKKFQVMRNKKIFFAGQITGVEGYIESVASGLICARALVDQFHGRKFIPIPKETILGSLVNYVTNPKIKNLKPMKANLGIINYKIPHFDDKHKRNKYIYENSIASLKTYLKIIGQNT